MAIADIATRAWLLFLLALVTSAVAMVFVTAGRFLYKFLRKRYPRMPELLVLAVVTFACFLVFLAALEVYLGISIPAALAPSP